MTNASNTPAPTAEAVELLEERFGPLPQRAPADDAARARLIAGLHALIDFLLLHPHLPATSVTVYGYVEHLETLERLAGTVDTETYGEQQRQFDVPGLPGQVCMIVANPRRWSRPL